MCLLVASISQRNSNQEWDMCWRYEKKKNSDLLNSSYLNNPFISHAMPPSTSIKDVSIAIHVLQITRKLLGVVLKFFASLEILTTHSSECSLTVAFTL